MSVRVTPECTCKNGQEMFCKDVIIGSFDYPKCSGVRRAVFADLAEGEETRASVCDVDFASLFPSLTRLVLGPEEGVCDCLPCYKNIETDGCKCESRETNSSVEGCIGHVTNSSSIIRRRHGRRGRRRGEVGDQGWRKGRRRDHGQTGTGTRGGRARTGRSVW